MTFRWPFGGLDEMGKVCLIVIIGGLGTVLGPVLGAFFVVIVAEFLRGWVGGYSLLIFATIMILAVRFVRGGFMEIFQVLSPRIRDKYVMLIGKKYKEEFYGAESDGRK